MMDRRELLAGAGMAAVVGSGVPALALGSTARWPTSNVPRIPGGAIIGVRLGLWKWWFMRRHQLEGLLKGQGISGGRVFTDAYEAEDFIKYSSKTYRNLLASGAKLPAYDFVRHAEW